MTSRHAAISPSRANDFRQCPLKFRYRTIDRLPEPPSLAALKGTIVHAVLEHLYDAPPLERTELRAQDLLEPQWREHIDNHPDVLELFDADQERIEWLESARPLISNYFRLENPQFLQPAVREGFVNATLPSGLAIRGIIDRVDEAPNGDLRVVDYKTGKSPNPRYQGEAIFQMRFYAAAIWYTQAKLPARTQLIYLGDGRILTYDPVPDDVTSVSREIDEIWSRIRSRIDARHFEPRPSRLCDWCHFKDICPAFNNESPAISEEGIDKLLTAQRPQTSAH